MEEKERLTPGQAIRAYCVHCVGGSYSDVHKCDGSTCPFHRFRLGRGRPSVKAVRKFCLDCMGGSSNMVSDCQVEDCFCHPYRFGKNPWYGSRPNAFKSGGTEGINGSNFDDPPEAVHRATGGGGKP